tara:strand:- start:626 stop:2062 length:1437 start_codon:yes stop_codon:yes gene_type:complete
MSWRTEATPFWEDIIQEDDSSPELLDAYADAYWDGPVSPIEDVGPEEPWYRTMPVIREIYRGGEFLVDDVGGRIQQTPIYQDLKPVLDVAGAIANPPRAIAGWMLGKAEDDLAEQGLQLDWGNLPASILDYVAGVEGEGLAPEDRFIKPLPQDEEEITYSTIDPSRKRERAANEREEARLRREAEEEIRTGPSWDPMGLTNLLGDQIGLINQLTQAGLMNTEQWRDATLNTLDSVYGDLQAEFQAQLDDLSERELASIENMGLTTDDIAAELAEMGVERSVLSLEEQAIADAMALQSGNQMDFAQNLVRSAQLGQADRVTSAMNAFNDINMGIQTGHMEQVGQLQNMAQAAQVQGQALGVDPAILFADMIYGTGIAQQQMSANASAAANAQLWADAEYLAQRVPDFGGDPRLAYSVLSGQLPGNYFKPTEGSFLDSLQPGVLSLLGEEIQNILLNNQNIRFEDAVRLAEDALYFNPME